MYVVKRDGRHQDVKFDKITARIEKHCYGLNSDFVRPAEIAQKVCEGIYPGVTTIELDELTAETAAYSAAKHPDFSSIAGRICISNLHKTTNNVFSLTIQRLYENVHMLTNQRASLIADDVYEIITQNAAQLNAVIDYNRDYMFDYFGFKTLQRSYLLCIDDTTVERPQDMFMRVAIGIHKNDIDAAIETYDLLSQHNFTHATPTLFNAGTPFPQMSSCFVLEMQHDSIDGIYNTLKQCAQISKHAGGIGLSIHNVRATNSYIHGTNGESNGIVPMLRVFSDTARYVDQGGGKRKGSFAIYVEPWHADIFEFLDLKKNHGNELQRARDLFYGLWIPDLFMERVQANENWSLMCPNECPGLHNVSGDAFKQLYEQYESEGRARTSFKAQKLWFAILQTQVETGNPYMLYKDTCNRKSNQQHLGTIKSSNLCCEIIEYTSPDEVAVCNLASINLSVLVTVDNNNLHPQFNIQRLYEITKVVTRNLNKVIDQNLYPVQQANTSNIRHRPIGIGVQGLADCFCKMRFPFESPEARQLNKDIFETIYFSACETSMELAQVEGPYPTYEGSPASNGQLQYDMWDVTPSERWDWETLKQNIAEHGMRNSLLVAPMPTASTAQILGNNESIEPFTSNMYTRRVLAGEFTVVNKHLLKDLTERGLWTHNVRNQIIADMGSIQNVSCIPHNLKQLYKTVWEIKQKCILDMAADRGPFICQSQSLNIHMANPSIRKLTSMHFYGWKKGLKTGMYYLRTRPKADAIQFTVDQAQLTRTRQEEEEPIQEPIQECLVCSA